MAHIGHAPTMTLFPVLEGSRCKIQRSGAPQVRETAM